MKQEMMGFQCHQLDHMQIICSSLQTDNHAGTSSLEFSQVLWSSWCSTNSAKALKAIVWWSSEIISVHGTCTFLLGSFTATQYGICHLLVLFYTWKPGNGALFMSIEITHIIANKSSAVAEMVDRLAAIDMGQKERTGCSSALEYPYGLFLSLA